MNKEIYVVCRNFGSDSPSFFHPDYGWGKDKVEMYATELDALVDCQHMLGDNGTTIERFVTQTQARTH